MGMRHCDIPAFSDQLPPTPPSDLLFLEMPVLNPEFLGPGRKIQDSNVRFTFARIAKWIDTFCHIHKSHTQSHISYGITLVRLHVFLFWRIRITRTVYIESRSRVNKIKFSCQGNILKHRCVFYHFPSIL